MGAWRGEHVEEPARGARARRSRWGSSGWWGADGAAGRRQGDPPRGPPRAAAPPPRDALAGPGGPGPPDGPLQPLRGGPPRAGAVSGARRGPQGDVGPHGRPHRGGGLLPGGLLPEPGGGAGNAHRPSERDRGLGQGRRLLDGAEARRSPSRPDPRSPGGPREAPPGEGPPRRGADRRVPRRAAEDHRFRRGAREERDRRRRGGSGRAAEAPDRKHTPL